jgi:hypothetical protein
VATPEIRKTGAIASWITCAMAAIRASGAIGGMFESFHQEAQSESF